MTSAAEFQTKVTKTGVNMDRLDGIVNGGPDTVVTTDNGDVPSLAKVIGDIGDIAGAVVATAANAAAAQESEIAAEAAASQASSAVASLIGLVASTQASGTYPAVDGSPGANITAGSTLYAPDPVAADGALNGVSVYSPIATTGTLVVSKVNGDNTLTRIPALDQPVMLSIGSNNFPDFAPNVSAGWLIGVNSLGNLRIQTGQAGKTAISTAGLTGTSTAKVTSNNSIASVSYKAVGGEVARSKGAEGVLQKQFDGSTVTGGQYPPASLTSTLTANFAGMCNVPTVSGPVTAVSEISGPTDAVAYLVTRDASFNITSIVKRVPFAGKAGHNYTSMGSQAGGLYVVVLPKTASLTYQTTGGTGDRDYPFAGEPTIAIFRTATVTSGSAVLTGLSATADLSIGLSAVGTGIPINTTIASIDSSTQVTLSANATAGGSPTITFGGKTSSIGATGQVSVGWLVVNGTGPRLDALETAQAALQPTGIAAAGFGLVDSADKTGAADATAIFAAARSAHATPNVPPGIYSLTSWPYNGEGFWGPGIVKVGGITVSLPIAPERGSRYLKLRAFLMSQIISGSCLILNADSIGAGYHASSMATHFLTMLTRFANLGIAVDECVTGNFNDADPAGNLLFQGITLINPTTCTLGPNGAVKSLMLQPGQSIGVTGAYERVDVTYTGVSGGQLAFSYNNAGNYTVGTTYKTVNCNATGNDVGAVAGATGQSASKSYMITNTGSVAVEITSLMRFGVKVTGSPPRLYVCRFAHGNFKFTDYDSSKIASMLRIANAVGGGSNHMLIPGLGTNDGIAGVLYAAMKANVSAYAGRFVSAGLPAANMLPIMPWRWNNYPSGGSYEDELAGVRDGFKAAGVTRCIQTDAYDFIGQGLSGSDGHPLDAGELVMKDAIVSTMSAAIL